MGAYALRKQAPEVNTPTKGVSGAARRPSVLELTGLKAFRAGPPAADGEDATRPAAA